MPKFYAIFKEETIDEDWIPNARQFSEKKLIKIAILLNLNLFKIMIKCFKKLITSIFMVNGY